MNALTRLDKAAVGATAAAAAFKVLLWSVGAGLDGPEPWLPWVRWAFALVSFVAFDLVVLAVVADQRAHGRRHLGTATMACAAALSGGVALHVAGVVAWPALHAGPAVLLLLLGLHLSDTRGEARDGLIASRHVTPEPASLQVTQAVQVNVSAGVTSTPPDTPAAPARHVVERPALQADAVTLQGDTASAPAMSPTARIKELARQAGVSDSTMRRRVERGEVTL